jgi:protein-disulfide isomerase
MRNILIALGIVAVAAVAGVAVYELRPASKSAEDTPSSSFADAPVLPVTIAADDRSIGNSSAPVTIVEYASLTCPHCAHFETNVLPAVKTELIDSGKVRLIYRDYPLDGLALRAAMMVRCAGPERTFGFLDLLFSRQAAWIKNDMASSVAALATLGAQAGMSESEFNACLANQDIQNAVTQSRLDAERLYKINSTPSFLINGRLTVGAPEPAQLIALVDTLLPGGSGVPRPAPPVGASPAPSSSSSPQR